MTHQLAVVLVIAVCVIATLFMDWGDAEPTHPSPPTPMQKLYKLLIFQVIAWLHGFSSADFGKAYDEVVKWAKDTTKTGAQKRDEVIAVLAPYFQTAGKIVSTVAMNFLIESVLSYARKIGEA